MLRVDRSSVDQLASACASIGSCSPMARHCSGPEHRQVGQALDAEPARKPTLDRGFPQDRGHECEGQRHPDRALALAFADGERLMVWVGSIRSSSSQR
jgi:hypothetical protein